MFSTSKPRKYRQIIDELLDVSMNTTGQINVRRVRDGNWPRIDGEASPLGVQKLMMPLLASPRTITISPTLSRVFQK
jgi:hypothetical protein